ncbi:class F sortase [Paenibacillus sp. MMO-177]|uniref:class F sortase n=1 Tax=Paenibacillus sp. MMO-177 TaxID=3081289 RepID=UPI003017D1B2
MSNRHGILILVLILLLTGCASGQTKQPIKQQTKEQTKEQSKPNREIALPAPSHTMVPLRAAESKAPSKPKDIIAKTHVIVPDRIWIPSVGIKAPVEPVGLLENGQLGVPASSDIAGLFIDGVLPGEKGNAIIAGHVDNYTGPAIFYPLKKLKPGDPVILSDSSGKYLVYSVDAVEAYPTAEAPLDKIFGDTNGKRLNMITCTGKYNRQKKEHEKRLVVYTHLLQ